MGAVSYTSGSGSFNVPSVVEKAWVSCVGGGGGGFFTSSYNTGSPGGGGGGAWGYGARSVSSTSISYIVGAGASRNSSGGTSTCLGVIAGGGGVGQINSGGSGGTFSAPSGANGGNGNIFANAGNPVANHRGGHAGGVSGGGTGIFFNFADDFGNGGTVFSGGGGNGNNGFGSIGGSGQNATIDRPGNGGTYGGGGGGWSAIGVLQPSTGGSGAGGFVYVSWIDLTAGKTTLRSGESTTVSWDSPVSSGSTTVSYTNTGTSNITETYTRTDSRGAQSTITFTILPAVRINSFTANPNPQTSGVDGVPNYDTLLTWTTTGATSGSINQGIGSVSFNGSRSVSLPQSTAGSNSPSTITYTLTVSDGFDTDSDSITVSAYNDNNPPAFTIPDQTNLEPNQSYIINVGTISSSVIDMITRVTGLNGATVSKNNTNSWTTTMVIDPNNSVQVRFFSLAFNQSPEGLTNSTTYGVTIGTQTAYFTATTRAPDVNETFNLPNESDRVPYPDIDTIDEPSEQYIVSNTLSVDDIELQNPSGVEIRTNNGNAQIRKKITGTSKWGSWQNVRSI